MKNTPALSECRHLVADFWGCRLPDSEDDWRDVMHAAVNAMGATLLRMDVHLFEPQGGTAIAMLAESHLAIHTWPERDYVAIDVFTCGATVQPDAGIAVLRRRFCPQRERLLPIVRGEVDAHRMDDIPLAIPTTTKQPQIHRGEAGCR